MSDRPTAFTAENALLIAATRVDAEDAAAPAVGPLDLPYLVRASERQGVAPLLYEWLGRHSDVRVDEATRDALHEAYWMRHFRNRLLLEELRAVLRAATEAGIDVMPLKGAELAPAYYPTPALRPLSDLDLLVRPGDVARMGGLLQQRGYTEVDHAPSYVEDEWLDIDSRDYCWFASRQGFDSLIEYRPAPLELAVGRLTDLDEAYTAALRRHAALVWERSTPSPDGAGRVMSPEDLLLHVTTHLAAKHLDFRLVWLHDIARIALRRPHLDWAYVAARAADLRVVAPVTAALEAARRYAAAPITDAQLQRIRAGLGSASAFSLAQRDLRRLMRHVDGIPSADLTFEGPGVWPLGAALSRVRGVRARLRVLRWVLLPGREYLEHRGIEAGSSIVGSAKRLALRVGRRAGEKQEVRSEK
ncbi:MAG: nucleotidyltransferase family protein [Vicinamibacterales bacterium]